MNAFSVPPSPGTPANQLFGRCFAGYQCWFRAGEDPDESWGHWSHRYSPEEGNYHPEMYPDFADFPDTSLYPCRMPPYPDGSPARFYNGHDPAVIDVHYRWLAEYGVDGLAIQRFFGATSAEEQPEPTHLTAIREAAEKYGRLFYVMYDTSGCGRAGDAFLPRMQGDVIRNIEGKGLIASPACAHVGDRPVICIWGLSPLEKGRYPAAADALAFIQWLKERGYYVIGGLPDNGWAEETGEYAAVYGALDMISPWTPGRFRKETLDAWIGDHLQRDLTYCKAHGKDYQPVMFAGFAWSNFGGGGNPNCTPRDAGRFLWAQAKHYARAGVQAGYFAMFDEFDEGTALAKTASDSFGLPGTRLYAQTQAVDGWWLSSDFYLRLAGAVTALLRGERSLTEEVPVPHSEGPVYWRNGFELREAAYTLTRGEAADSRPRRVDVCDAHPLVLSQEAVQLETAAVVRGQRGLVCYTGCCGFAFSGIGMNAGRCHVVYRLALTDIPVTEGLTLSYRMRAVNEGGGFVHPDLILEDGSLLSAHLPALLEEQVEKDFWGHYLWKKVTHRLPASLAGRRITGVAVAYDRPGEARFAAYIDDIIIEKEN